MDTQTATLTRKRIEPDRVQAPQGRKDWKAAPRLLPWSAGCYQHPAAEYARRALDLGGRLVRRTRTHTSQIELHQVRCNRQLALAPRSGSAAVINAPPVVRPRRGRRVRRDRKVVVRRPVVVRPKVVVRRISR